MVIISMFMKCFTGFLTCCAVQLITLFHPQGLFGALDDNTLVAFMETKECMGHGATIIFTFTKCFSGLVSCLSCFDSFHLIAQLLLQGLLGLDN